MSVSENIKVDIRWWMKKLPLAMKVFRCSGFDLTIFTDASDTGWGAKLDALETCDLWSKHQLSEDINFKELLAVKYALESLASNAHNCSILLRIDNFLRHRYFNVKLTRRPPQLRVMDLLQNFFGVSWYPILKLSVCSLISWALGPIW
uniref:RNase H type-1 domain-containing protein n=1 Tax=Trichogramma kaykai TaxID=54128 RepID=A0ABD2WKR6_9HYME